MKTSSLSVTCGLAIFLFLGIGSVSAADAIYNTAGTTTWICPEGITALTVECWGGGGAGGAALKGSGVGQAAGGGGGGGAYARKTSIPVTPGVGYSVVIPAAATNPSGRVRVNGGSVTFTGDSAVAVTAAGGKGGMGAVAAGGAGAGGAGGTIAASVGDVVFAGGAGFTGVTSSKVPGGAGGGGAGDASAGGAAMDATAGAGGVADGGDGGAGHTVNKTDGQPGTTPGGGGGGAKANTATQKAGGTGGLGQIRITYELPVPLEPFPVDLQVVPGSSNLLLSWTGSSGASYGVETATNLVDGNWEPMRMGLTGDGASISYTGTVAAATHFFRVQAIDSPGLGINPAGLTPETSSGVTLSNQSEVAVTLASSFYMPLDLDAQTKAGSLDPSTASPVPLGPCLVAGEGPHPDNHTVVRILTEYQIPEVQFLAFPPEVRGGVGINCGWLDGESSIVAHSLSGSTNEIRIFDRFGGLKNTWVPVLPTTPFAVAVGDIIASYDGDEIAVASETVSTTSFPVDVYSSSGDLLDSMTVSRGSSQASLLNLFAKTADGVTQLIVYDQAETTVHALDFNSETSEATSLAAAGLPVDAQLHDSRFTDRDFNAGGDEDLISTLYKVHEGTATAINAGREENIFWFAHPDWPAETNDIAYTSGTYIKRARFAFLGNMVKYSEVIQCDDIEGRSYEEWTATNVHDYVSAKLADEFTVGVEKVWSPSFTHRWNFELMDNMAGLVNDIYQLPRYRALDRSNDSILSGYNGDISFYLGSYAYDGPGLNEFYSYGIREGLRQIAVEARAHPTEILGIEPNHENEIVTGENDGVSFGDYNPYNIAGFYRHLLFLYGSLEAINERFGTPFSSHFFDAPRDLGRGDWDAYGNADGFSQAWYDYNASVVYRRVGDSYREALLAGFPPESITCHMVPDSYSQKVEEIGFERESPRITPIDWLLTAGTSFGCSRYGNWYQNEFNAANGLHSSGFDNITFVEYSPFTSSDDHAYNQLLYMMTNGIRYIGGFASNASLEPQKYALRQAIAENDQPRRGPAGGISEVRPAPDATYDIVALGTGEKCTGLIKSVKSNGKFNGIVYTAPFHAHVDISTLVTNQNITVLTAEKKLAVVDDPYCGMQLEFVFSAYSNLEANNGLTFKIYHDGVAQPFQEMTVPVTTTEKNYRVIHKLQLPAKALTYKIETTTGKTIQIHGMNAYLHEEKAIRLRREVYLGERHKGGVTFDVLNE